MRAKGVSELGFPKDYDDFVEALASDLVAAVRRRFYGGHLFRVQAMRAPAEKLVYLFLVNSQPQTFTSIRRALSISRDTVDRTLKKLLEARVVYLDDRYLYWLVEEI